MQPNLFIQPYFEITPCWCSSTGHPCSLMSDISLYEYITVVCALTVLGIEIVSKFFVTDDATLNIFV